MTIRQAVRFLVALTIMFLGTAVGFTLSGCAKLERALSKGYRL